MNLLIFLGSSTCSIGNLLDYVETTGFDRAGNDIETIGATSKAPALLSEDIS